MYVPSTQKQSMPHSLRPGLFRAADRLGVNWLLAHSAWRQQRLVILCYHGVSLADEHEWDPELYVSADFLRSRMQRLRDGGYNVLPLGEAVQRMYARTLPPKSVVVTFDDGWYDFGARAAPVLQEFDIPAT